MKFSPKEKFLLKNKYKNLSKNMDTKDLSNGTTLIILPDHDIAFDLAKLFFENNITADISTSIMQNMDNNAVIEGENGKIIVDNPWMPGRDGGPYDTKIRVITNNAEKVEELKGPEHLFIFQAELASQTILKQLTEVPYQGMTRDDSLGNIKVLVMWRTEIGYYLEEDN